YRLLRRDAGQRVRGRVPLPDDQVVVEHRDAVGAGVDDGALVRPLPDDLRVGDGVADRDARVPGEQLQQLQLGVPDLAVGEQRVQRAVRAVLQVGQAQRDRVQ